MKAIVIEGAQGASEYQFGDKLVIEKFNSSQESKWGVYPAGGCGNIFHVLDSLASLAKKDYMCDHIETDILICYDTTVNSRLREDFLADYNEWITNQFQAELNGLERVIRFHLVSYYCFEDCLLLSNNLLLWVYSENRRKKIDGMLLNSLKEYRNIHLDFISKGITEKVVFSRFRKNYRNLEAWFKSRGSGDITTASMEQIAGKLLLDLTLNSYFRTDKKRLSRCWLYTCYIDCKLDKVYQAYLERVDDPDIKRRLEERECGLFYAKLDSQEKIECLIESSAMLSDIINNNSWLLQ